ncbi:MAG: complex I intermediate-associated protein 30-domain-containing protein [Monoraphidium minutum]|nr:MAG: complex I intermediate-associated protein 30-domain-containing protein [Monoraphidium minutum]
MLLRSALLEAANAPGSSAAAWALRRAFDSILGGDLDEPLAPVADAPPGDPFPVLDCSAGLPSDAPRWQVLDDVVMGGASSSAIAYDDASKAIVFSGNVTTAFNGGFASVRSLPWLGWAELGRGGGVRLLVRGDGRTYKLNLKTDDSWDGVAWQADFQTAPQPPGAWQEVDLPFSVFRPQLRGRVVGGQAPLGGGRVRQLGLMVSKVSAAGGELAGFSEGPFSLAVRAVLGR